MQGFDFDGVITIGHRPSFGDVIITGRSYQEAPEIISYLHKNEIYCAVYFNPIDLESNSLELSGLWKADMINSLRLTHFYEDNAVQANIIKELCNVNVVFVE